MWCFKLRCVIVMEVLQVMCFTWSHINIKQFFVLPATPVFTFLCGQLMETPQFSLYCHSGSLKQRWVRHRLSCFCYSSCKAVLIFLKLLHVTCIVTETPRYISLGVFVGKITSLDTSLLRASMKPGWEDLVRRCIQRFHLQNDGDMSFAKRHQQEGTVHLSG